MSGRARSGVSVVIPAHNEREGLRPVLEGVGRVLSGLERPHEILVVDDGSTDGTSAAAEGVPGVRVLRHDRRRGYGRSLADGLAAARFETIAILDADGTYPPGSFPALLEAFEGAVMAVGLRREITLPTYAAAKSVSRRFLHLLARLLTGRKIPDLNSGFRVFKRSLWSEHKGAFPEGFSFTTTLTMLAHYGGGNVAYVPIDYRPRIGSTKVHYLFDGLRVAAWMIRLAWRHRPERILLPAILLLGLAIRAAGAFYGLPGTYHPDEPHHVNLAAYFGSGDLNPHVFKYPTLWMYALAGLYGLLFVAWSAGGFLHSPAEFAHLFIWNPTPFYLSARLLSGCLGTASLVWVFAAGRRLAGARAGLAAAAFMAASPHLVHSSHMAKADMLMLFFASAAWWFAIRYLQEGRLRDAIGGGVGLGLAVSSQYTAALISPLLLWAHILRWKKSGSFFSLKPVILGYLCVPLAFLAGTPFALFDHAAFLRDIADLRGYGAGDLAVARDLLGLGVLRHYAAFVHLPVWGAAVPAAGLILMGGAGLFITGPLLWAGLALGLQSVQAGGMVNYAFCVFPGVAIAAGALWPREAVRPFWKAVRYALVAVLFVPPAVQSFKWTREYWLADTRTVAKRWIEARVPPGTRILLDQVHVGPPLTMTRGQVARLLEKTRAAGHPRRLYYERMLESHPGGGYEILRILRTPEELISMKRHTEWSQSAYDLLDVEAGLSAVRGAGVEVVVLSSFGARPENSPRLSRFFREIEAEGELVQELRPASEASPLLRIYRLRQS